MAEERLFPAEPAPGVANNADAEAGMNLGTVFVVGADGNIIGAHIRVSDTPPSGECRLLLFVNDTTVANKVITIGAGGAWARFDFDAPLPVVNGDECVIYYHQVAGGGVVRYCSTSGTFAADVDSANLHGPDSTEAAGLGIGVAGNGVFTVNAAPALPVSTFGQSFYSIDPIFEADEADVTAPVLSNATATETGQTTASLAVDTDEGNGTLFWVVTTSATPPSGAQVAAGQDHTGAAAVDSGNQAVVGTGTQTIAGGASGLTAATEYWAHFVQDDAATNRSNVDSSDAFTTDAEAVPAEPIAASEGAGGGGPARRGRRYPYPNVIDDGWDWEGPDARAEPEATPEPTEAPEKPSEGAPEARKPAGLTVDQEKVLDAVSQPQRGFIERAIADIREAKTKADAKAAADAKAEARVAALEAEVEALRTQVDELKAKRRDDEEERQLLGLLMEDKED